MGISDERAGEAENLLESLATVGEELQSNVEKSASRVESMKQAQSAAITSSTQATTNIAICFLPALTGGDT